MIKAKNEAKEITNYITKYIKTYVPSQKTASDNTLKSYRVAIQLYLEFLEEKDTTISNICYECFDISHIEQWLEWLLNTRKKSTTNCE